VIYIVGLDSDRTFRHFLSYCVRAGTRIEPINLRELADAGDWRLGLPVDGQSWLRMGRRTVSLDPIASYYCRLIDLTDVQPSAGSALRWRGMLLGLQAWLEAVPGVVVNRPCARVDNFSKPLHESTFSVFGMKVPASITSSDAGKLSEFAASAPSIVKAVSGIRGNARLVLPQEFDDFEPRQGPVHLQRYIKGEDVRAHVLGQYVHAELIRSDAADYRAATKLPHYEPWTLPHIVRSRLIEATSAFGLTFAGWDMKLDAAGTYWVLEANPMPGYDGYDARCHGAISKSLLETLEDAQFSKGTQHET
jgi:RimK-like ATP-grasp domain